MYGFDDPQASAIIRRYTLDDAVAVSLSLDKSQAGGQAEKAILASFNNQLIGNSIFSYITTDLPFAAALALVPIVVMIAYLSVARKLGAFEHV